MRKLLFLVVVLLVMAGWTVAQTSGGDNPSGQAGTSAQSSQSSQSGQSATGQSTTGQSQSTPSSTSQTGNEPAGQQAGTAAGQHGKLPQTASPLPLLGLLGMGSLGAGLVVRRRKN